MEEDAERHQEKIVGQKEVGQRAPLIESNTEQGSWDTEKSSTLSAAAQVDML